jgi:hypothetical protein
MTAKTAIARERSSMTDELPPREEVVGKLYAAVLSDVLDSLGYFDQALRPFVRPLDHCGPAATAPPNRPSASSLIEGREEFPHVLRPAAARRGPWSDSMTSRGLLPCHASH